VKVLVDTPEAALALLARERVLTLVPAGRPVSLIVAIVGAPIAGSWWGHPAGKLIFRCATALEESPDVLVAKLVAGKVTFVHRPLFAPLYRVLTDPARVAAATGSLSAAARRLFERVASQGELRLDRAPKPPAKLRAELESHALVHAFQVHTETGNHATLLRPWSAWAAGPVAEAAEKLTLVAARKALTSAGLTFAGFPSTPQAE
jgi:hypothetical protein